MQINTDLNEQSREKLEYLKKEYQQSTAEVIQQAIDALYEKAHSQQTDKLKALLESDFVGCAEGSEDLSSDYKQFLAKSWAAKHGLD